MRFKIRSKVTIFALFYFVSEGNFPSTSPRGAYIWRGDLTEGFLCYEFEGAYIWRGVYMEGLIFGILRYFSFRCKYNFLQLQYEPPLLKWQTSHNSLFFPSRMWTHTFPLILTLCPDMQENSEYQITHKYFIFLYDLRLSEDKG